jgi:hypothetical protein
LALLGNALMPAKARSRRSAGANAQNWEQVSGSDRHIVKSGFDRFFVRLPGRGQMQGGPRKKQKQRFHLGLKAVQHV